MNGRQRYHPGQRCSKEQYRGLTQNPGIGQKQVITADLEQVLNEAYLQTLYAQQVPKVLCQAYSKSSNDRGVKYGDEEKRSRGGS